MRPALKSRNDLPALLTHLDLTGEGAELVVARGRYSPAAARQRPDPLSLLNRHLG